MQRFILSFVLLLTTLTAMTQEGHNYGESEQYRRSSLALILVTHEGKKYASQIEQQFYQIVPPERYNEHHINVHVIPASGKMSAKKIAEQLRKKGVAGELVSTWFNRNYNTGFCDMNLIQERGLYNASKEDNDLAQMTQRKDAMLKDAGEELIQNTFVLVCDLTYHDKQKRNRVFSYIAQAGLYAMGAVADTYAQRQGSSSWGDAGQSYRDLGDLSQAAIEDIAGFEMNVHSYLFRLDWNKNLSEKMYGNYWVDSYTPSAEAEQHRQAFNNDQKSFTLSYIGDYSSRAGRRASASRNDLNLVVRDVCENAVNKSVEKLAKMYTVFKPKAPFYCGQDGKYYAYIGTKEGVNSNSKYEIIEPRLDKKGILSYNRKAMVHTNYSSVWKNSGTNITQNGTADSPGTAFFHTSGSHDVCDKGYLIREVGKAKNQVKKHSFNIEVMAEPLSLKQKTIDKYINDDDGFNMHNFRTYASSKIYCWEEYTDASKEKATWVPGVSLGWNVNFNSWISWNIINGKAMFGGKGSILLGVNTGLILRFAQFGNQKRLSLFLWPTVGYAMFKQKCNYDVYSWYYYSNYDKYTYTHRGRESTKLDENGFDWHVKLGLNIKKFYMAATYSRFHKLPGVAVGFNL